MAPRGPVSALIALRDEGVIGAIGIASGTIDEVYKYVATGAFDAALSHNRLTLVDRSASSTFLLARNLGMTTFNAAPFGGGTLTNGEQTFGYQPMPPEFAGHLSRVRNLALDWSVELAAAALRFSLRHPLVDTTVVGISSTSRLADLDRLLNLAIPAEFFDAIDALGPPLNGND